MTAIEPEASARAAGLRYVSDLEPGIARRRRGRGFSYRDADGAPVRDTAVLDRIRALAVPPAWADVWICRSEDGHLQATGRDVRTRKQYRYHDLWREVRDQAKFDQLADFGGALPDLRTAVDGRLARRSLDRETVVSLVVALLDETLVRVGNERYAEDNETFGLTTVRQEHVEGADGGGAPVLRFIGKSGVEHDVRVDDRRLARIVRRCHELGGQHLFTYRDGDGDVVPVTSADVNGYLRTETGLDASAKDFRTWGGTVRAVEVLGPLGAPGDEREAAGQVIEAIDDAAALLHNTRAVCRASYVHPTVLDAHRSGDLAEAWRRARRGAGLTRAERTTLTVLAS